MWLEPKLPGLSWGESALFLSPQNWWHQYSHYKQWLFQYVSSFLWGLWEHCVIFKFSNFVPLHVKVQNFKKSLIANQTTLKNKFLYLFLSWIRSELTIRLLCGRVHCCHCLRKSISPLSARVGRHEWDGEASGHQEPSFEKHSVHSNRTPLSQMCWPSGSNYKVDHRVCLCRIKYIYIYIWLF